MKISSINFSKMAAIALVFCSSSVIAAENVYSTSLIDLDNGYSENELAMDAKISGRPVEVTGHIFSISQNYGEINICLKEDEPYSLGCMGMRESQRGAALKLISGREITIRCTKMSGSAGDARGGDCEIIK